LLKKPYLNVREESDRRTDGPHSIAALLHHKTATCQPANLPTAAAALENRDLSRYSRDPPENHST